MSRSRTIHQEAAEHRLDTILADPQAAQVFAHHRATLKNDPGAYPPGLVDAIGQLHARQPRHWPPEQLGAFVEIHAGLMAGYYASGRIRVGATPSADRERAENAAHLANLPEPFTAYLDLEQNGAECDGTLTWATHISMTRSTGVPLLLTCHADEPTPVYTTAHVPPRTVPLEVGYTMPSRTLLHLNHRGGVARWPYGSEDIYLLVRVTPLNLGL